MIKKDKHYIYTLAFFYSLIVIIVVAIPLYFYISVEKKSFRKNQMQNLQHYAYGVEKSIYDFSRSPAKIFDFPRSLLYSAYLYNEGENLRFSTSSKMYTLKTFTHPLSDAIYAKITLSPNRLHATYLVIKQEFSYKEIYYKAMITALFLGAIIFLLTLFFIKISMKPLERVNRYLTIFFNDAMHELKTPLGVMQLNLELLKSQHKTESKPLRRVFNSMQNMNLIYEDIEYHIKHTHVSYRPEKIDFSYFLQQRIDVFRDLAEVKSIMIEEQIIPDVTIFINRIELQRIIDNTLSNAIKYSEKNKKITVTMQEKEHKIIFAVKDQGIGIKDTKRIFERYRREDTIQGGFGIGLSIVKYICDKNHIQINIQTSKNQGTIFTYTFTA